ncbi:ATP-binding cassette subfamily C protein CydC [Actinomadura pelletieri DSM 43383]|uniref:ATP-binding cassette subfamily C protein CydC n=1 Tax=Actinomadura pelletieri DSM 43383 TaxID=1120940 RepID=A0A495QYP3_9ACTN|nr:thiol reductant ABC exporter subunit CydC [Actinomadura pelletieri]RKS79263.1 ATP-binding cassette subfamily C protein CydC [Actinomadura pelletieri DSM 43383]
MILRLLSFARPARGRLALAVLFGVLALGSGVALMATSAWLISRAAQHPPVLMLMVAIVAVRAFGLGRGVFRYLERLTGHDATFRILADLRARVYERLERLGPGFHSGDLLNRLVADVDAVQDLFLRVLLPCTVAAVVGALSVGLAWALLPSAGAVLLCALLIAGVVVPWLTAATARRAEHRTTDLRAELTSHVVDTLHGAPELIAYGAAPAQLAEAARLDRDFTRASARSATTAGAGAAVSALAGGLAVWGSLAVGVPAVRSGALDGVLLAVIVLLPLAAFEVVNGLPLAAQYRERVHRSATRVFAVLDAPEPVPDPQKPTPLPKPPYTLRIENLQARWTPTAPPALNDISLTLTPGRRCAIVGPSGSGKTTLTAVLLRFLERSGGQATLNNTDIRDLTGDDVRRVIGLCAQDAHLFDSTIGANIRLARPTATDEEIRDALRRARLLDWIDTLPQGLDTHVGEHGAQVSGGQRQRIALARALLADFPILLLDEPAEHLDIATADALTADLLTATEGRTTLLVTHRLTGLDAVDEIIVLDKGQVIDRGTHTDLLSRPGLYRTLWHHEQTPTPPLTQPA